MWRYEDREYPNIGLNAVIGRPKDEWSMEPARFDEMRRGCWDIDARIADMDLAGIWASLSFPSLIAGFCGHGVLEERRPRARARVLRAWNDWHLEVWAGAYPDRIIPLQLPWLADPQLAAEELRRNAERGFKAVSFPELPAQLGLPSLHTGDWDPFLAACEETETVVCLHTGSAQWAPIPAPDTPFETITTLFPVNALVACADWLWSGIPVRFPRAEHHARRGRPRLGGDARRPGRLRPRPLRVGPARAGRGRATCCRARCCGATSGSARSTTRSAFGALDAIGADHILVESDYPHADSTWPDTQEVVARNVANLSADDAARITHRNAAELFRHPLPDGGWLANV